MSGEGCQGRQNSDPDDGGGAGNGQAEDDEDGRDAGVEDAAEQGDIVGHGTGSFGLAG